jgi:hypothetical protein
LFVCSERSVGRAFVSLPFFVATGAVVLAARAQHNGCRQIGRIAAPLRATQHTVRHFPICVRNIAIRVRNIAIRVRNIAIRPLGGGTPGTKAPVRMRVALRCGWQRRRWSGGCARQRRRPLRARRQRRRPPRCAANRRRLAARRRRSLPTRRKARVDRARTAAVATRTATALTQTKQQTEPKGASENRKPQTGAQPARTARARRGNPRKL